MLYFLSKGHWVLNFSCATVLKQNHSVATLSKVDCKHLEISKFQQHRCNLISKSGSKGSITAYFFKSDDHSSWHLPSF